jgi:hypothetical protein
MFTFPGCQQAHTTLLGTQAYPTEAATCFGAPMANLGDVDGDGHDDVVAVRCGVDTSCLDNVTR